MTDMRTYELYSLEVGPLGANCYLLADAGTRETAVIDPGGDPARIAAAVDQRRLKPVVIINTHGHGDHVGADESLRHRYGVRVCIHAADAPYLGDAALNGSALFGVPLTLPAADVLLEDGAVVPVGGLALSVIHTPGHSPGGICLLCGDLLFTGDTLFRGTVGRCDLAGGDEEVLMRSLERLKRLPGHLKVLPGHGPASTIEEETAANPYLSGSFPQDIP